MHFQMQIVVNSTVINVSFQFFSYNFILQIKILNLFNTAPLSPQTFIKYNEDTESKLNTSVQYKESILCHYLWAIFNCFLTTLVFSAITIFY
jgi:hypothetical protein